MNNPVDQPKVSELIERLREIANNIDPFYDLAVVSDTCLTAAEALAALPQPQATTVGVKALEWPTPVSSGSRITSGGGLLMYTIAQKPEGCRWYRAEEGPWSEPMTMDAAKAAAQADYDTRVCSALIVIPGAEYTPAILEMDREGDPCWEFVERDCLTVTGVVFAANVEQLFDADHQLIGFRIFKPSAGPGAEKGEAVQTMGDLVNAQWQELVEKDDRTSPEDQPDMALITRGELQFAMDYAVAGAQQYWRSNAAPTSERVQALEEALKPFAEEADRIHPDWADNRRRSTLTPSKELTVADFRRARAALLHEGQG